MSLVVRKSRGRRLDYANFNKKGFNSVTCTRTKVRRGIFNKKARSRNSSAPTSPVQEVNSNLNELLCTPMGDKVDQLLINGAGSLLISRVKEMAPKHVEHAVTLECTHGNAANNCSKCDSTQQVGQPLTKNAETKSSPVVRSNISKKKVTLVSSTGMAQSLEERKRILKEEVAALRKQVQQREDEDEEMRQLLEEQRELKRKLSSNIASPIQSKKFKRSNKKPERNNSVKNNPCDELQSLAGLSFDMSGFMNSADDPSVNEVNKVISFADKKALKRKVKKSKTKRKVKRRSPSPSDVSSSSQSSSSDSDPSDSDNEDGANFRGGKNLKSGRYAKPGDTKLVSRYAHTAIDDELGGDRDLVDLSFNLLVAGELEIVSSELISDKEKWSRIEMLKRLAYRSEVLPVKETLDLYSSFLRKVEKGKFRWGSKTAMRQFDQQLVFAISMENKREEWRLNYRRAGEDRKRGQGMHVKEERKKYCADFNRGECQFNSHHEGKLNGQLVMKFHISKKCLYDDGAERGHAEKDCFKK